MAIHELSDEQIHTMSLKEIVTEIGVKIALRIQVTI